MSSDKTVHFKGICFRRILLHTKIYGYFRAYKIGHVVRKKERVKKRSLPRGTNPVEIVDFPNFFLARAAQERLAPDPSILQLIWRASTYRV